MNVLLGEITKISGNRLCVNTFICEKAKNDNYKLAKSDGVTFPIEKKDVIANVEITKKESFNCRMQKLVA